MLREPSEDKKTYTSEFVIVIYLMTVFAGAYPSNINLCTKKYTCDLANNIIKLW